MEYSYRRFSLDLTKRITSETFNVKQGDSMVRLVISVTENGYPYDLSGCAANFYALIGETTVFDACEIEGNEIGYTLSSGVTATPGAFEAEIRLYGGISEEESPEILSCPRFEIVVDEIYADEPVETSDSFTALTGAITRANSLKGLLWSSATDITDAGESEIAADTVSGTAKEGDFILTVNGWMCLVTGEEEDGEIPVDAKYNIIGEDGFSPTVTVTETTDGHTVTITDAAHPQGQTFTVLDGADLPQTRNLLKGDGSGGAMAAVSGTDYLAPNGYSSSLVAVFSQASTRSNIASGEKLSVVFGKIMKWFSDLKAVAFSGSYNDLSNKPTIPTVPTNVSAFNNDAGYLTEGEIAGVRSKVYYGTASGRGSSQTKTVTVDGFPDTLENGITLLVSFPSGNSAEDMQLNVNNTGAYPAVDQTGNAMGAFPVSSRLFVFIDEQWVNADSLYKIEEFEDFTYSKDETDDLLSDKYTKPSGGIPKADLASTVQTSLGRADSAMSKLPSLGGNGYILVNDYENAAGSGMKFGGFDGSSGELQSIPTASQIRDFVGTQTVRDSTPQAGSSHLITSGGVANALNGKQTKAVTRTVTIAVADWAGGTTCTKSVTGVTATSIVIVDTSDGNVECTAQGAGTLTFTATSTPTSAVTVKVVIL